MCLACGIKFLLEVCGRKRLQAQYFSCRILESSYDFLRRSFLRVEENFHRFHRTLRLQRKAWQINKNRFKYYSGEIFSHYFIKLPAAWDFTYECIRGRVFEYWEVGCLFAFPTSYQSVMWSGPYSSSYLNTLSSISQQIFHALHYYV